MIRGKKLTAIIPARGGSKGIPGKNSYRINGETLVERTIKFAKKNDRIDDIYVSTDVQELHELAEMYNCAPPTLRPEHLATDKALTIDVVNHLLDQLNINDGYILLLQVTSPLRNNSDLENILDMFQNDEESNAIVSVTKHKSPHPDKLLKEEDNYLVPYNTKKKQEVPRQELKTLYALNGAFYLTSVDLIKSKRTFLPKRTKFYEMPSERSINLDEPIDLLILELLLKKNVDSS